jgi:hypothetical protein
MQWLHLFESLGSPGSDPLLPHLSLRVSDAGALREMCPRVAASLRRILAETSVPDPLAQVNGVLAAVYAEMEQQSGGRFARAVFALASDGLPTAADVQLMARWDGALRALRRDVGAAGLPAAKREVVVAVIGHYLDGVDPLESLVHGADRAPAGWLVTLIRWRRFASLGRALARVLTAGEREQLVALVRAGDRDAGVRASASGRARGD